MKLSLRYKRVIYANLLNLEYLLGLVVSYLFGAERWGAFGIVLVLTLVLGCVTTAIYWGIQDETIKTQTQR